ncbi:hypothetical protein [Pedobacter endophyticus]|uniref:Uncharacterized protein n=1 Tax=Pedobacter endophyticus TaxID=2789740 RepID=A0A7S9L3T0_9SPHI|nr:hypothetical protein [Pedobacter endophyticus]QPH41957.1 hypothetical protein IZT61_04900 [Pedobacter endophyticus]
MKKLLLVSLFLIFTLPCLANDSKISNTAIGNGIGIGSALAVSICWSRTQSVLTSAIAGIFGWLYVIYYLFVRNDE